MGRLWEYVYWRLPVGKRQFFDKANAVYDKAVCVIDKVGEVKRVIESGFENNQRHQNELYDKMGHRLDELTREVKSLQAENVRLERILTHYHKQDMQMFWEEYRKDSETTEDAQKRFFLSLPKAKGVSRNLQLLERDLLRAFIEICEKNNLSYWVYAGSLLGTVRHKGFIPWDDDVDTCMVREDIELLRKIMEDNEQYRLTVRYDAWGYCKQIRFCYKDSKVPVFIDVFPFDWAYSASRESWEANYKMKLELKAEITDESNPLIREFRKAGCVDDDSVIGRQIAEIFDKYYRRLHEEKVLCSREDAKGFLAGFDNWNPYDDSNVNNVEQFFPLQKLEFEGIKCNVPNQYMYILHEMYGEDFYTFPCGEPHFIHADWKKNEKLLAEEVKKRIHS